MEERKKTTYAFDCEGDTKIELSVAEDLKLPNSFRVWRSGHVLCCYLTQNASTLFEGGLDGKKVLELGSGCGLAGMVCAKLGAEVTMTDTDDVLDTIKYNVAQNWPEGTNQITVKELNYEKDSIVEQGFDKGHFDIIIGSELTFLPKYEEAVPKAVKELCCSSNGSPPPKTKVIIVHTHRRIHESEVRKRFTEAGFKVTPVKDDHEVWKCPKEGACSMNETEASIADFQCSIWEMEWEAAKGA